MVQILILLLLLGASAFGQILQPANGGTGVNNLSFSGNTHKVATVTGTLTPTHCVNIDANGNLTDAGATCGGGGGGMVYPGAGIAISTGAAWASSVDPGTSPNVPLVSNGSHGAVMASGTLSTGGSGTSSLTLTPTTIGGLSGLSPATGDHVLVSDAASCGDTSSGGGSTWEQLRYNGSGWTLISCSSGSNAIYKTTQTLGSGAANITFSSIPNTYTNLLLTCRARTDAATGAANALVQFNGDVGSDYSTGSMYFNGSGTGFTPAIGSTAGLSGSGTFPGTSAAAGYPAVLEISIPNYADTAGVFIKEAQWRSGFINGSLASSNVYNALGNIFWAGSASTAINQISVAPASGNFVTGSTCTLELR